MGERTYISLFSLFSIAAVVWLGWAYAKAPYIEIWPQASWSRWVPLTAMAVACLLAVIGLSSPNPFSLGAGHAQFDAARPGIVAIIRHPVIWALVIWSAAHIPPNGDVASLILFGLLTVLGLTGPITLDRRRRRAMGETAWAETANRVAQTGWKKSDSRNRLPVHYCCRRPIRRAALRPRVGDRRFTLSVVDTDAGSPFLFSLHAGGGDRARRR